MSACGRPCYLPHPPPRLVPIPRFIPIPPAAVRCSTAGPQPRPLHPQPPNFPCSCTVHRHHTGPVAHASNLGALAPCNTHIPEAGSCTGGRNRRFIQGWACKMAGQKRVRLRGGQLARCRPPQLPAPPAGGGTRCGARASVRGGTPRSSSALTAAAALQAACRAAARCQAAADECRRLGDRVACTRLLRAWRPLPRARLSQSQY